MAVELCRANGDADIIAFPAHFLGGASARGGGSRGTCGSHVESLANLGLRSAIVVSCVDSDGSPFAAVIQGGRSIITVPSAGPGARGPGDPGQALESALWDPRGSIATVNTSAGPVQLGLLSGAATMDHAMAPRSLMLAGAELLINPVEQSAELTERDDAPRLGSQTGVLHDAPASESSSCFGFVVDLCRTASAFPGPVLRRPCV